MTTRRATLWMAFGIVATAGCSDRSSVEPERTPVTPAPTVQTIQLTPPAPDSSGRWLALRLDGAAALGAAGVAVSAPGVLAIVSEQQLVLFARTPQSSLTLRVEGAAAGAGRALAVRERVSEAGETVPTSGWVVTAP